MNTQHGFFSVVFLFCVAMNLPAACAQQNLASDISAGRSARLITLPSVPGTLETYFINLKDNDVVHSPFRIIFGVTGLGVAPAGVKRNGTGHHHLLVDTGMPTNLRNPLPHSNNYIHFDGGQTEGVIDLPPGKHTLQLLFADGDHRPLYETKTDTQVIVHSKKISIVVEGTAKSPQ